MLVSRSLSEVAEGILYRYVSLRWYTPDIPQFTDSIASCARRGTLVTYLSIFRLEWINDGATPVVLAKLIAALPNLRTLRLRSSVSNSVRCDAIFVARIPHLRKFISNLKIGSRADIAFFDFLAAHKHL